MTRIERIQAKIDSGKYSDEKVGRMIRLLKTLETKPASKPSAPPQVAQPTAPAAAPKKRRGRPPKKK